MIQVKILNRYIDYISDISLDFVIYASIVKRRLYLCLSSP